MPEEIHKPSATSWLTTAFIARCARRYADLYVDDPGEPAAARTAVAEAVWLAEARASMGGERGFFSDALELDGKFFDHHDILSVASAVSSYAVAASNTYDELAAEAGLEPIVRRNLTALRLASIAVESAFPEETDVIDPPQEKNASELAVYGEPELQDSIASDLAHMEKLQQEDGWNESTPAPTTLFPPLWPNGRPSDWPAQQLTFRPRARIIRTIGDRLVSGPEAAVIELVKNSYDADATAVRITFFPPLKPGSGSILFEDNGHGMSLVDIQEKWMEPATSDKKHRKQSPEGRQLLGSKGIGRFAVARLGNLLELISVGHSQYQAGAETHEKTRIAELDWDRFERTKYLDDVSFPIETASTTEPTGTTLRISGLRDDWSEAALSRLHHELRRLVSPIENAGSKPFKIVLDLSNCTKSNCGFDGLTIVETHEGANSSEPFEVRPFPMLEACDYSVDGIFDENGLFDGTMTIRRAGTEPEAVKLSVPLQDGEDPCGIFLVKLNIFDREAASIRSTAQKAGFGHLGVREARKLLDSIAGIAIYREGFRVRPYGDPENDWLTLDAKRVQNPSIKIGHNQVSGVVIIDDEHTSQLVERSSREGLEENGSFRRLQSLILALLSEVVEPHRRRFRIGAGLDVRKQSGFREALGQAELPWAQHLLERLPEGERVEAQKLITRESERLTGHLKDLEARQAQLEAQVTLGLIIGEVMHQGNTPLAFIETEVARLQKWWPRLFESTDEAEEDRAECPKILRGLTGSATSLRSLFNALSPLAGARRGEPQTYSVEKTLNEILFLFKSKSEDIGLQFLIGPGITNLSVKGYPEDLATALTNLIDNAIYWIQHHTIKSARIEISASDIQPGKATIFVHDNGVGVPEQLQDQLFDVGFTMKPNGTGLGLSIAREAIYRSAGDLYLAQSDTGARFAITLPKN
jgi:signal transduction histidine kinase